MTPTGPTWSAHPDATGGPSGLRAVDRPGRVVGLGAVCTLRGDAAFDHRNQSFAVGEFLRLDDGRLVVLHEERGFTVGAGGGTSVRDGLTAALLTQQVLNVVLPDEGEGADGEGHPWTWLAGLARGRGVEVTAEELRSLTFEVVLAEEVTRWLAEAQAAG